MSPPQMLEACHLQMSDTVADFGAGSGFMAKALSSIVTNGNVFAIEINRDLVSRIDHEAKDNGLKNLHPMWGDIEIIGGSKLADESVDFVVLSNILFQLDDKNGALKEAYRVLKPGGRILVVDWSESFAGLGPTNQRVFSKEQAETLMSKDGFTKLSDNLPAGEHHYAIIFKK